MTAIIAIILFGNFMKIISAKTLLKYIKLIKVIGAVRK